MMSGSKAPDFDTYGLLRATHSLNPTQYSHIVGLSSYFIKKIILCIATILYLTILFAYARIFPILGSSSHRITDVVLVVITLVKPQAVANRAVHVYTFLPGTGTRCRFANFLPETGTRCTEMYSHPNSYTSLHYLNSFANWKLSGCHFIGWP